MTSVQAAEVYIAPVRAWLETVVIALNLCPFARRAFVQQRVRFTVSAAADEAALLKALQDELLRLHDDRSVETTLLIHPHVLQGFYAYNQFLDLADELLNAMALDGVYQIASFHPDYQFVGTEPGDVENYSNRSPYPLLHLLREDSLDRAIADYPDTAKIPERNVALLEDRGASSMQDLLARCFNR